MDDSAGRKKAIYLYRYFDTADHARLFVAAAAVVAAVEGDCEGRLWGRTQPSEDVLSPASGRPMICEISSCPPSPASTGKQRKGIKLDEIWIINRIIEWSRVESSGVRL